MLSTARSLRSSGLLLNVATTMRAITGFRLLFVHMSAAIRRLLHRNILIYNLTWNQQNTIV